ncbi:MAG: acyl-CoA synthetase [Gammaproteobacteria bacterium]|nr:acyl-CoA synthetase [Gammaproteobacteria bacterium]
MNIFERDLDKNAANYAPLTPLSFLARAATVYPDKTAIIDGARLIVYRDFYARCRRFASALRKNGIGVGDTVAIIAPNTPPLLEAHYGVPGAGAVINALNTRLDAGTIRFILEHGEAKLIVVDRVFADVVGTALDGLERRPLVVDIDNPGNETGAALGDFEYEAFIAQGDEHDAWILPDDEWQAISLNYTSGTTGNPKGVVYHHRGAYLNALGNALAFGVNSSSVYLWTLPMFHCNGWTYTWAVTAAGGTHVCLRAVDPALIFPAIAEHRVTHMCGAPIVLNMLINAPDELKRTFPHTVEAATGGAAPPSTVISRMEQMGFHVVHLYGLTETYGPATLCAWQDAWDTLDTDAQAQKVARQGVRYQTLEDTQVIDAHSMRSVPPDGETIGELMIRGNTVMKGYLKNPAASREAFAGGWFHTGDLAVMHPDSYAEVKDRAKDIIISGGENISSLEVEEVLYKHPAVLEAAVVARPDDYWGETPCAFVTLKPGNEADVDNIIAYCKGNMAHFKVPKTVIFGDLPKTSTGKIQKVVLRERTRDL